MGTASRSSARARDRPPWSSRPGAGGDRSAFRDQFVDLGAVTRVSAPTTAPASAPATHGRRQSPVTLGDLADELALVLEGAGIEEPIVLASHSLGGGVAQFYADRYPERVAGLVFVDSIAIPGFLALLRSRGRRRRACDDRHATNDRGLGAARLVRVHPVVRADAELPRRRRPRVSTVPVATSVASTTSWPVARRTPFT